ncbi:MAG: hypothetical protein BWX84_01276 [Verrucomicrobia bacterium ADurb.Bin118]|nr:MAG: hypothetical protein BWX84_01276 [Verrucomicrobia bacterium ADurb.Bin118]
MGAVKYFAAAASDCIAAQLQQARERDPVASVDLAALNLADSESFFRRKR